VQDLINNSPLVTYSEENFDVTIDLAPISHLRCNFNSIPNLFRFPNLRVIEFAENQLNNIRLSETIRVVSICTPHFIPLGVYGFNTGRAQLSILDAFDCDVMHFVETLILRDTSILGTDSNFLHMRDRLGMCQNLKKVIFLRNWRITDDVYKRAVPKHIEMEVVDCRSLDIQKM